VRSDFDPRETRRAIAQEGLCALAHGLLYPFGLRRSRHRSERRPDQRTLVLVHGLGANRSSFFALQAYLWLAGYRDQLALTHRSRGSIEGLALQLKRTVDAGVRGGRIDLIAHSIGGLVCRFYLQYLGGARRVDRLITLGTPHRGTHAAAFVPSALVRQLEPGSPFLRYLNRDLPPGSLRITSLGAGRDLLIQPLESALYPFGERQTFADLGHLGLLFSPRVFQAVRAALDRG
jgi:triacylglycerol esterase/lipase EstA (alpha/beta hydrolase family)